MKKLALILALIVGASSIFAADAANDVLLNQRNGTNDDNVQRNVTATANSLFAFDGSLIPTATAAPILASVQANASGGLLLKNFSGTTVMTVGPGSGTGVAFNASGLTSVNSVTAAASTDLTLAGGSSGASLVLGSGPTNAASTITNVGTGGLNVVNGDIANVLTLSRNTLATNNGTALKFSQKDASGTYVNVADFYAYKSVATAGAVDSWLGIGTRRAGTVTDALFVSPLGNVITGPTATEMTNTTGGLTVAATGSGATATAVNTGGLRSANFGLSTVAGGASYFGGNLDSLALTTGSSATAPAVTIRTTGNSVAIGGNGPSIASNATYNSGWKYIASSKAPVVIGFDEGGIGDFGVLVAPAGTAGNAITWTTALSISNATKAATFAGTGTFGDFVYSSKNTLNQNAMGFRSYNTNTTGYSAFQAYNAAGYADANSAGFGLGGTTEGTTFQNYAYVYTGTSTNGFRVFTNGANVRLTIDNTGAATFAGSVTHTLGTNLPPQTAPASPASGWVLYTDSGDGNKLKAKASTGTVVTIGTP